MASPEDDDTLDLAPLGLGIGISPSLLPTPQPVGGGGILERSGGRAAGGRRRAGERGGAGRGRSARTGSDHVRRTGMVDAKAKHDRSASCAISAPKVCWPSSNSSLPP
jgi:hypothetical protein